MKKRASVIIIAALLSACSGEGGGHNAAVEMIPAETTDKDEADKDVESDDTTSVDEPDDEIRGVVNCLSCETVDTDDNRLERDDTDDTVEDESDDEPTDEPETDDTVDESDDASDDDTVSNDDDVASDDIVEDEPESDDDGSDDTVDTDDTVEDESDDEPTDEPETDDTVDESDDASDDDTVSNDDDVASDDIVEDEPESDDDGSDDTVDTDDTDDEPTDDVTEPDPFCGDGTIDPGEQCDDGNNVSGDGCSACITDFVPTCGNFGLEQGEECDDGNLTNGDGCSSTCEVEDGSDDTDDTDDEPTDDVTEPDPFCGDGTIDPGEQCDDGNNVSGDGCSACITDFVPTCGNFGLEQGEECDDGNLTNGDGCSSTCEIEAPPPPFCGDGAVNVVGEECDDGNSVNGDGCEIDCTETPAPSCTPTAKSTSAAAHTSLTCGNWQFWEFSTAYDLSGDAACVGADDCYFALGPYGAQQLMRWNGLDVTAVTLPTAISVTAVAAAGNTVVVGGAQGSQLPVVYRKIGTGAWTQVTGFNFPSGAGEVAVSAIGTAGNSVFAGVTVTTTSPGPCQGLCPTVRTARMYQVSSSATLLAEISQAVLEGFTGTSATDVTAIGAYVNSSGVGVDALLQRWNGCEMEDYSSSIPSDVTNLNDADTADGETVLVGNTGSGSVRLAAEDLSSWSRFDTGSNWIDRGILALGSGSSLVVGEQQNSTVEIGSYGLIFNPTYAATRSVGTWSSAGAYIEPPLDSLHVSDLASAGSEQVALTREGVWVITCL